MSWWQLGEGIGFRGNSLELWRIACPFCGESGNFSVAYHAEKVKSNSKKKLNFDTLKCGNCTGYVMCLWSAAEGWGGLYDFKILPWPTRVDTHPQEYPDQIGRYWIQAHRTISDENWDAAAVMARSAIQLSARQLGAKGKDLNAEIEELANQGKLPPIMRDWAHEVRALGNAAAHPRPEADLTEPRDAKDIVAFLDRYLEYVYTLPDRIKEYRERRVKDEPKT
jgi:hypothetical protein